MTAPEESPLAVPRDRIRPVIHRLNFATALRWAAPASIMLGYVITSWGDSVFRAKYALCTLLSIMAFALLLSRLDRPLRFTLPFWILFLYVWLAYYLKFYWLAISPEIDLNLLPFEFTFTSPSALDSAFATITCGCVGIFVTAWMLLNNSKYRRKDRRRQTKRSRVASVTRADYRRIGAAALSLAIGLSIVTTVITLQTGIAVMGLEAPTLPYHLGGIIYLTRNILIPALLLLAFWAALEAGQQRRVKLVFFGIVLFGVTEMLLRSSRGALAPIVLSVAWLLILKNQLGRYAKLLAASALLIVVLHPIVSAYRNLRIHQSDEGIGQLLSGASREVFDAGNVSVGDAVSLGAAAVLFRATGAEVLIWYDGLGLKPLGARAANVVRSERGVSGFLTVDAFGFPETAVTAIAPGLIGWMYVVGGNYLALFGLAAITMLVYFLWRSLLRQHLSTELVAQALFLTWLTLLTMDGVVESLVNRAILVWPFAIISCEWIARALERRAMRARLSSSVGPMLQRAPPGLITS